VIPDARSKIEVGKSILLMYEDEDKGKMEMEMLVVGGKKGKGGEAEGGLSSTEKGFDTTFFFFRNLIYRDPLRGSPSLLGVPALLSTEA